MLVSARVEQALHMVFQLRIFLLIVYVCMSVDARVVSSLNLDYGIQCDVCFFMFLTRRNKKSIFRPLEVCIYYIYMYTNWMDHT